MKTMVYLVMTINLESLFESSVVHCKAQLSEFYDEPALKANLLVLLILVTSVPALSLLLWLISMSQLWLF